MTAFRLPEDKSSHIRHFIVLILLSVFLCYSVYSSIFLLINNYTESNNYILRMLFSDLLKCQLVWKSAKLWHRTSVNFGKGDAIRQKNSCNTRMCEVSCPNTLTSVSTRKKAVNLCKTLCHCRIFHRHVWVYATLSCGSFTWQSCDSEIKELVIQTCLVLAHRDFIESSLAMMCAAITKDVVQNKILQVFLSLIQCCLLLQMNGN